MEQPGILYVARFSFRFDGKIIVYRQAKANSPAWPNQLYKKCYRDFSKQKAKKKKKAKLEI